MLVLKQFTVSLLVQPVKHPAPAIKFSRLTVNRMKLHKNLKNFEKIARRSVRNIKNVEHTQQTY